ncbi:MAG: M1 family metallopeptidase [Anaerolineae bacterium]|nr:M1 family metallopeptidase [Anaerolineae bacterium]
MLRRCTLVLLILALMGAQIAIAEEPDPDVGSASIGDSFYPALGNGGYDTLHYALDLDVDVAANLIEGQVTITAQALHDLRAFNLDFAGFDIAAIVINDQPATWDHNDHELTVTPAEPLVTGEEFTISVHYSGEPRGLGLANMPNLIGWVNYGEGVFVASEPAGAAGWYPVNDHPLDKATYSFAITVDDPYVVAANGVLQDTIAHDDGTITYLWAARDPIASYLVIVAIGDFVIQTEEGPDGLPIRNYYPPRVADIAEFNFMNTSDMIAFYNDTFGPYPFEAYGVVVVDASLGFALETQTLSLFGADRVIGSVGGMEEVIAHELAHQWFGDSVSLSTWRDMWLNEGFATYASWLWFEHILGEATLERRITDNYELIAADARRYTLDITHDQILGLVEAMPLADITLPTSNVMRVTELLLSGTQDEAAIAQQTALLPPESMSGTQLLTYLKLLPVDRVTLKSAEMDELFTLLGIYDQMDERPTIPHSQYVPPGDPVPRDLFNRGLYLRGALLLHALRLEVGDDVFFEILRTYCDQFAYGNATTADFIATAEDVSGADLANFFESWLYDPVMPDIPAMGLSVAGE